MIGVIGLGLAQELGLLAVGGVVDRIAGVGQRQLQLPRQVRIVFNSRMRTFASCFFSVAPAACRALTR